MDKGGKPEESASTAEPPAKEVEESSSACASVAAAAAAASESVSITVAAKEVKRKSDSESETKTTQSGSDKNVESDIAPPKKRAKGEATEKSSRVEAADSTTKETAAAEGEGEAVALTIGAPRKFRRIPIFIADYHNDVLEFIYRCLATRHLPLKNNMLVHFDAHADMVISRDIPASASFDKETMLAELSIENWIMPSCYAGHFNRVIWLKNSWCRQMPVGKYNFKIGHKDDKISVTCPLDYFISEGNYCEPNELQGARDMELQVINVDTNEELDPKEFMSAEDAPNFVLDVDLDFFSTANPFLDIYKDAFCYEQLTEIFHFESSANDCGGTTERRKQQLETLKRIFEHLEEARTLEGFPAPDPNIIKEETFAKIGNLAKTLQKNYGDQEIDWLLIYDSGSTTDVNGLPHHISTDKELDQYFGQFKQFLQRLPAPPVLITMARSAEDDYCPKDQVDPIQERALGVLREVFGEKLHEKPIMHYLDEEWDVMNM